MCPNSNVSKKFSVKKFAYYQCEFLLAFSMPWLRKRVPIERYGKLMPKRYAILLFDI